MSDLPQTGIYLDHRGRLHEVTRVTSRQVTYHVMEQDAPDVKESIKRFTGTTANGQPRFSYAGESLES